VRLPKNKAAQKGRYAVFFAALLVLLMACPMQGIAQDTPPAEEALPNKTLHITSDRLVADQNALYILFTGNVDAIYGDMRITSDALKIFYTQTGDGQAPLNREAIDEIIATGHVRITLEDKTAICEKAVYDPKTETIRLTGENTRMTSGENYITGEKITIRQDTGEITVDAGAGKRVNAVFTPENDKPENL